MATEKLVREGINERLGGLLLDHGHIVHQREAAVLLFFWCVGA
jgi:hypothetical protein